jgi:hypothetical protein
MTNLERAQDLYNQVGQGKLMQAFETYYAENVVMDEPSGKREGKDACRISEEEFLNKVEAFHGMEIKAIAEDSSKGKVLIEVTMDLTFKGASRMLMEQVSVQTWENGQITHERFYYNAV